MGRIESIGIDGLEITHDEQEIQTIEFEDKDTDQYVLINDKENIEKLYEFLKRRLGK